ncbi:MAG: DNA-processing protein DprA [Oscillospiraceae bacterium]|nr:DNA-processing protein DprA [Oscillospiraceae bacterium]
MRNSERGFLLLTSHLGDPESKPLTVAQFRTLINRVKTMQRYEEERELTRKDLMSIGYGADEVGRILQLLSRQDQLEYYVNRAAKTDCYPITRISPLYPASLRERLGVDCPGCLWAKGDSSLLARPMIALVGSRELEPDNMAFAREAGRQAALQGYVLLSGNARGADRAAQDSCLENGGQVVSIVADSLEKCKDTPGVLYLSEDSFDFPFSTIRALSRNRLIHAMGTLTLVAQCTYGKGGTWSGTVQNLRHGWSPVFCYADGSKAAIALSNMGAIPIATDTLSDFGSLKPAEMNFL